jgi:hypothetical protein
MLRKERADFLDQVTDACGRVQDHESVWVCLAVVGAHHIRYFFSPFEVVIGEGAATVLDNSWLVDSQVSQARFHVSAGCQLIFPEEVLIGHDFLRPNNWPCRPNRATSA